MFDKIAGALGGKNPLEAVTGMLSGGNPLESLTKGLTDAFANGDLLKMAMDAAKTMGPAAGPWGMIASAGLEMLQGGSNPMDIAKSALGGTGAFAGLGITPDQLAGFPDFLKGLGQGGLSIPGLGPK